VHEVNTRAKHELHRLSVNLSCIQMGVYYSRIKIFNSLPPYILEFKNEKRKFKATLRQYLIAHTFYSLDKSLSSSQVSFPLPR
jgi:hypothetical protein